MLTPSDQSNKIQFCLGLLLVLSLCGTLYLAGQSYLEYSSWQSVLKSPTSDSHAELLRHLQITRTPISDLVTALAHPEISLSLTARKIIDQKINQWEQQPAENFQHEVVKLINEFNQQAESFGPSTEEYVRQVSSRLSTWRFNFDSSERMQFNQMTERLLKLPVAQSEVVIDQTTNSLPIASLTSETNINKEKIISTLKVPPAFIEEDLSKIVGQVPKVPNQSIVESSFANRPLSVSNNTTNPLKPTPPADFSSNKSASPLEQPLVPSDLSMLATFQVMQLLNDSRTEVAGRVTQELIDRKFSKTDIDLARRLVHPNVEIRRTLVQELPQLQNTNQRYWLNFLRNDPDPEIKSKATKYLLSLSPQLLR